MTEHKKPLTDEEKAARVAEAQAKIAAAQKRQEDLMNYENKVSMMTTGQLNRELNRIGKNGGLDTAISTALRIVLNNTRVEPFEIVKGKIIPKPHWQNELGRIGAFLR